MHASQQTYDWHAMQGYCKHGMRIDGITRLVWHWAFWALRRERRSPGLHQVMMRLEAER
jgi:hypothetical protein